MQDLFFVSHNGEQQGPFSIDEIVKRVRANEFDLNDYIYDEAQQDWVMFMAYPAISSKFKPQKPKAPPGKVKKAKATEEAPTDKAVDPQKIEWFVLKGDNKFGPFSFLDLVKMLQDKSIFEFDYVWHEGLVTWKRIAEMGEFNSNAMKQMKNSEMPELNEVFFRRRHARAKYGASILVHDNRHVWKGTSIDISAGGAGVVVENALLQPGQTIYLHFKPGDGVPPFNAVCEVVSKKYVDNVTDRNTPIQYGVRFTSINQQTQQMIQDYANQRVNRAA